MAKVKVWCGWTLGESPLPGSLRLWAELTSCGSRTEVSLSMLAVGGKLSSASRGHLHSLLVVPFLHLQSRQWQSESLSLLESPGCLPLLLCLSDSSAFAFLF